MGYLALSADTKGSTSTAVGVAALATQNFTSATNSYNTAVGYDAGSAVTTGINNTIIGGLAGDAFTTGNRNTLIGRAAGTAITTSNSDNTFIGEASGSAMTTGDANTFIGRYNGEAGLDLRTSSNNIVLSDGDGNPRLLYTSSGDATSYKNFRVGTSGAANGIVDLNGRNGSNVIDYIDSGGTRRMVVVAGSGDLQNVNNSYGAISDVKLKENITDAASQWDDIKALTVRKYSMKADNLEAPNQLGVIAQELEAAGMNGLVSEAPDMDADNNDLGTTTKAVKYSILYMKAVKALQEAMIRIEALETKVAVLEG